MSYWDSDVPTDAIKPTLDQNAASPPVPAAIAQQTPEFVQRLIVELDETRNERSAIFAERYGSWENGKTTPPSFGQRGYRSRAQRMIELDKMDSKLCAKEDALQRQLQDIRTTILMAPKSDEDVELEHVPPVAKQSKGFNANEEKAGK